MSGRSHLTKERLLHFLLKESSSTNADREHLMQCGRCLAELVKVRIERTESQKPKPQENDR